MATKYWFGWALLLLISWPSAVAARDEPQEDPWQFFVTGRFLLVGQQPNGGAAYAGEATISSDGKGFLLRRTIGGKTLEAKGKSEVPQPPGEGKVLRFRWQEGGQSWMLSCLVSTDLDNYARLSCVWGREDQSYKVPGLESYYSSEVWSSE